MHKNWLFIIILFLTLAAILSISIVEKSTKYTKLVVSKDKWTSLINNKKLSTNISLNSIEFNDYNLLIDNENNIIYYSIVDTNTKYNPSVQYKGNEKLSVAINTNITDNSIEKTDKIKVLIYNDKEYRIYNLVTTTYPILNIKYSESINRKTNIPMSIELFDNNVNTLNKVIISTGKLKILEENKEYSLSLTRNSVGKDTKNNYISIFNMKQSNEYIIKEVNDNTKDVNCIKLFINNKYIGLYSFESK